MRLKHHVILAFVASLLMLTLSACRQSSAVSGRLVALDSLCATAPDSAAALLRALSADSLHSDADRAYHALLVTQADYKAYLPATSDSLINLATDYYERHHNNSIDHERYVRTLVYHGTTADELGNPVEAVRWLKQAEAATPDVDHYWRGYIAMRIASIYHEQLSGSQTAIDYYKTAITEFKQTDNLRYTQLCMRDLGGIYRFVDADSAYHYLRQALSLAEQMNNEYLIFATKAYLSGYYFSVKDYRHSIDEAMAVIQHADSNYTDNHHFYFACNGYAMLGLPDSAEEVLRITPHPICLDDTMNWVSAQAEIARARGLMSTYYTFNDSSERISLRIEEAAKADSIEYADKAFSLERIQNKQQNTTKKLRAIGLSALVAIFVLACCLIYYIRKKRQSELKKHDLITRLDNLQTQHTTIISDLQKQHANLALELRHLRKQIDETNSYYEEDKKHLNLLFEKYIGDLKSFATAPVDRKKTEHHLFNVFRETTETNKENGFYALLGKHLDIKYNGIITYIKTHFPNLTQKEINFIILCYCGFKNREINFFIFTGEEHSITNKKDRIAKKMQIGMSLNDFKERYLEGDFCKES